RALAGAARRGCSASGAMAALRRRRRFLRITLLTFERFCRTRSGADSNPGWSASHRSSSTLLLRVLSKRGLAMKMSLKYALRFSSLVESAAFLAITHLPD